MPYTTAGPCVRQLGGFGVKISAHHPQADLNAALVDDIPLVGLQGNRPREGEGAFDGRQRQEAMLAVGKRIGKGRRPGLGRENAERVRG